MNDMEQNNLAGRLLKILRIWIDSIIPEQTKDCIRSKVAVVVKKNADNTYNVALTEDVDKYDIQFQLLKYSGNELTEQVRQYLNIKYQDIYPDETEREKKIEEMLPEETKKYTQFLSEASSFSIDNLFTIKNEIYDLGTFVIVGYLDNKLTNAFILCKNRK